MDARELSIRVRDAVLRLEQWEAEEPETLIGELEKEAITSLRAVQNLLDAMARQERLYLANDMDALLDDESTPMPGTFSRRRWREIKATFNSMNAWVRTPVNESTPAPLVVFSRRGNPPEPEQPEPEQPEPEQPEPEQPEPEPEQPAPEPEPEPEGGE